MEPVQSEQTVQRLVEQMVQSDRKAREGPEMGAPSQTMQIHATEGVA